MLINELVSSSDLPKNLGDDWFKMVLNHLNDAILITEVEPIDSPGPKILWANDVFYQSTGYEPAEVIGQSPSILQGPLTDKSILKTLRAALENWQVCRVEVINYKKDGSTFWNEFEVTPIANNAGFYTHWIAVQRDVTERKRLETLIKTSEERFSLAIQSANVGVWEWDLLTDSVYYSPILKLMLGYQDHEIDSRNWHGIVALHPDDKIHELHMLQQITQGTLKEYETEFRLQHKSGHYLYIQAHCCAAKDEGGKVIRIVGTCVDISQRKKAELREKSRTHILELITGGKPLPYILAAIVKVVEQDNPNMLCSILLLNDAGTHLLSGTASSLPDFYNLAIHGVEIGIGVGSCGTAAFTNERVIVDDIQNHPYWTPYKALAKQANLAACWSEPIRSTNGKVLGTFAIYHRQTHQPTKADLTIIEQTASLASIAIEQKQAEEKLKRAASVFTEAHEGIMITNATGIITEVNDTFSRITGYASEEAIGKHAAILKSERQPPDIDAQITATILEKGHWHGEIWSRRKNGEDYPLMLTTSAVKDTSDQVHHYVTLFTDITSIKTYQGQLERLAHYDALTNLPNRVLLADRLQQSMLQCKRRNQSLAVAFMDLDGFKTVNDVHGHNIGDDMLMALSQRMLGALREGDTLSRIGGDEFIAIIGGLESFEDCEPILERLLKAASEPFFIGDDVIQVSASIGVTLYPQDSVDADQLIRHADQAMYVAKQAGKNRIHMFDITLNNAAIIHQESIKNIRSALANNQFALYYQPKVNMRTGEVIGAEALIRWQHPELGLVRPLDFLPLIEGHPLSLELGEWVVDTALSQISQWLSMGINLPISVNVSAYQLQQRHFTAKLALLLSANPDVPSNYLELEILETSALKDASQVSETMNACRELGVSFALDDFGTGYSSLTYLKCLPAFMIKIDQSFVRDMLDDADDLAIIEGVVGLAKAFGRNVIAEGVETIAHGIALIRLGCDLAQGYGIARPMPAADIPNWILSWKADASWQI